MSASIEHLRVRANGLDFHVAVSGPAGGPAVFCLHGFPEGWMSWRPVMARLPGARIYAPDLRGYGATDHPRGGYDVFTLTDDVRALMEALGLARPLLATHDWGGALGWLFAHRHSELIRHLLVVNCTHPRTLVRAALTFDHLQPLRIPWVLPFQVPWFPEAFIATRLGRRLLRWTFTVREGRPGTMDRALVEELVDRFQTAADARGPVDYYRAFFRTLLSGAGRSALRDLYATPITAPVTVVWGEKDGALPEAVARKSAADAGCPLDWRPLAGVGHFVDLEAPEALAREIERVLEQRTFTPLVSAHPDGATTATASDGIEAPPPP